jgi:hypothetical protein
MESHQRHLSSEELERAMAGQAEPRALEHVAGCEACAAEIASFQRMFGELRESATEMATEQRRMAVVARPAKRAGVWGYATAAVVFVAVGLPVAMHHPAVKTPVVAGPANGAEGDAASVSDAELMTNVQNDLSSNVPEPMRALEGTVDNGSTTGSDNKTNSN